MPWERVDKPYVFEGPNGHETLADLFAGRSQLIVYHFMLGPDWEEGCKSCSFWADNFNGIDVHLAHRDVTLLAVSSAPFDQINAYKQRMGWSFKWVSSARLRLQPRLSRDIRTGRAGERRGLLQLRAGRSPRARNDPGSACSTRTGTATIYHTYSTYARGLDMVNGAYHFLDLAPKGRDEAGLSYPMEWVRWHDKYED